jgi:membrane protein DedA with SNARE-associated domain
VLVLDPTAPQPLPDRRTLVLLVAPIVVLIAVGTVANALTPVLLKEHPLLLIVLEARNRNLLAAANRVDLVPFLVFGTFRRLLSDPLFFTLGHLYGERALHWAERRLGGGDLVVKVTREGFRRASGIMVFLFPGALVCVLAGVSRMRMRSFLALNVAGTISAVILLRLFASVLEAPIEAVLRFNDRYVWWLTGISVVLVGVFVVLERARGEGEYETIEEIERELEGAGDDLDESPPLPETDG